MPFRYEDTSAFGPADLAILASAFDLAWRQLVANGLDGNDEGSEDHRRRLASCIMAYAKPGLVDQDKLVAR